MGKDKRERICFICFLGVAICFYVVAIMNFVDKDIFSAIIFLCFGSTFFCLSTTQLNKNDKKEKDE